MGVHGGWETPDIAVSRNFYCENVKSGAMNIYAIMRVSEARESSVKRRRRKVGRTEQKEKKS
jgi:hypothetical protein